MGSSCFLKTRSMRWLKAGLLAATNSLMEALSSSTRCPTASLPLLYIQYPARQQFTLYCNLNFHMATPRDLFAPFSLKAHPLPHLHAITPPLQLVKTTALIEGTLLRQQRGLYRGNKAYLEDVQVLLDYDRELAPGLLKKAKVPVNEEGTRVFSQCIDCGRYTLPFRYCAQCEHIHYCSEACEMRSKFSHVKICHPKQQPTLDAPLQVELHVGSDLGFNVELHYQHEMRMSLQMRGQSLVDALVSYYELEGQSSIPQNYAVEKVGKCLRYRKLEEGKYLTSTQSVTVDSLKDLEKIYGSNPLLPQMEVLVLRLGGILSKCVTEIHNNHIHLIYIFLCP